MNRTSAPMCAILLPPCQYVDHQSFAPRRLAIPESSRMNADDRLSLASLGRVEGGDGIVESRDVADVCPQPTNPAPLDALTNWARSGSTTKSIVRPPEGRASVGPVTVTSVP